MRDVAKFLLGAGAVALVVAAGWWSARSPRPAPPLLETGPSEASADSPRAATQVAAVPSTGAERATEPAAPAIVLRVNLTDPPPVSVHVAVEGPVAVRLPGTDRILLRKPRLDPVELVPDDAGFRLGPTEIPSGRIELVPEGAAPIEVDGHRYRGTVVVLRRSGGRLAAVNHVPLEDYVASVVDGEMPGTFGDAARQAQAIASRTYALTFREERRSTGDFDVHATVRSQRYPGFAYRAGDGRLLAGETEAGRRAARSTAGIVGTDGRHLVRTYFAAACGGRTVRGAEPFPEASVLLSAVPCEWCRAAPKFRWTVAFPEEDVVRAAWPSGASEGSDRTGARLASVSDVPRSEGESRSTPAFRIVRADGAEVVLDGFELRRRLSPDALPSPRFAMRLAGGQVVCEGRGHGHGVGLCQWGAAGQAEAGRSALDILRHYYPGLRFVRLEDER